MTMQPIETMPKDFEGFAWVACEDKDPVLVFVDEAGMAVAESLLLGEEHHEWFREELIKWWAPAVAPEFPAAVSEGQECREDDVKRLRLLNAELLEACLGVEALYSELQSAIPSLVGTTGFDRVIEAVNRARAVIAKVERGSNG